MNKSLGHTNNMEVGNMAMRPEDIFRMTLRQPTAAHLTESEASDRVQDLKDRHQLFLGATPRRHDTPNLIAFRADWQTMMSRERDYSE